MPDPERRSESILGRGSDRGVVRAVVLTVIHFVLWVGLFLILLMIVPLFVRVFADFSAELPPITVVVMTMSFRVTRYWYLFAILGIVVFAVDCGLLLVVGKGSCAGQLVLGILLALVPLVLGGFVLLAMCIPMVALLKNLT